MTGLGSSCGACKFLRRKCSSECVFAPYFSYDEAASHFAAVHKVFGASNVSKLLLHLPLQNRNDAASTISYQALARMRDPIYGCVAHIFALQQQITFLQEEIEILGSQILTNIHCGSSEATENNNSNPGTQLFPHNDDLNSLFRHFSPENLLAETLDSNGNTSNNQPLDGPECDEIVGCEFLSDPSELEGLFEGIEHDHFGNGNISLLNDYPIMGNCIAPI